MSGFGVRRSPFCHSVMGRRWALLLRRGLGQIHRVIWLPEYEPTEVKLEPGHQTNTAKFSLQLPPIGAIHKMDHMLRRDYVSVIVLIVFLGKFQRCLQGISYLICMNVVVQSISAYSPTPALAKPPLKSIGNVPRAFQGRFFFLRVATLYA